MGDFSRILVPIDGSVTSERAAEQALSLARLSQGTIDFLYVATITSGASSHLTLPAAVLEKVKESGNVVMDNILAKVPPDISCNSYCETGRPRDVILAFAEKFNSDVIVMGSRGLNPAESILVGSVSQYLVENAKCPVLVVK